MNLPAQLADRGVPYVQLGDALLIHGDCLEVLPLMEAGSVDAVVTDPPYGMDYRRNGHDYATGFYKPSKVKATGVAIVGDDRPFDPTPFLGWPCAFTGAQWFYDRLPAGGVIHTWDKRGNYEPIDQADVDQVWCSERRPARKLTCVWRGLSVERAAQVRGRAMLIGCGRSSQTVSGIMLLAL